MSDKKPEEEDIDEETVVGIHSSGIPLEEGMNMSLQRNYCTNCKRKTHCYVKVDRETKEAIVHNTCTNSSCECKCKTHYACRECGHLHPYGQKCNYITKDPPRNLENDKTWDLLLERFKEMKNV